MKTNRAQIERALDGAGTDARLYLLYGPDESQSRELANRLGRRMGADAERIDLTGTQLKADPARLTDEAASISLFGGARYIRVEPAGDEAMDAVVALLEASSTGNPVVLIAGALRKDSRLLKRALAEPTILAFASYLPEGNDLDRLAGTMAREHGLQMDQDIAGLLAAHSGGDRALLAREIEKLALYVDADRSRPAPLDRDAFEALTAESGEGDLAVVVDQVLGGRADGIGAELAKLAVSGIEGIALLRPLLRRLLLLAEMRAHVDSGNSVEAALAAAGRAVFWKDRAAIGAQLSRWTGEGLAKAVDRVMMAERAVKTSGSAGPVIVEYELIAIARYAARRR